MSRRRTVRRSLLVLVATIFGSAIARHDWAQNNEINLQFHAFKDTRSVTVLTPTVDLSKDFTDRTTVRVNFGLDSISAASDSCARCHSEGADNRRLVTGLSVVRKFNDL